MFHTLFKPLAATALSISLAIGGLAATTTPARADNDDLARFLLGATALFIIGSALSAHGNDRRPVTRGEDFRLPRHDLRRIAPDACYRQFRTNQGRLRGYAARCMQNAVARPGSLPPECLLRVHTSDGRRAIYLAECLQRHGWIREARRHD